ncbi:hypothetical protein LGQ02_09405 [Bacillus shivajii]|uniref:BC1872 family protein n=1 Tax=Bacillus shivajii TaxID=1983719 RepID=UPI001CFA55C4|nr:hypothetical protein [Bacillus shivajii]UCZ54938.1 hypothetical protein LGQ02_09405 [Bacillus shivajii]
MDKTEVIARRVLGWKLNRTNKWYNPEEGNIIENFQPDKKLDHAMLIVDRFEKFGFTYSKKSDNEVCFNKYCATGDTLQEAITNAAYSIAENNPIHNDWF